MEGHHKHNTNLFFGLFRAVSLLGLPALLGIACSAALAQAAPFAYITNFCSDTVSVIATATNTVTATVPVAEHPNVRRGSAFLGDYCMTLESSGEAWQTFAPTGWVEGLLD